MPWIYSSLHTRGSEGGVIQANISDPMWGGTGPKDLADTVRGVHCQELGRKKGSESE